MGNTEGRVVVDEVTVVTPVGVVICVVSVLKKGRYESFGLAPKETKFGNENLTFLAADEIGKTFG